LKSKDRVTRRLYSLYPDQISKLEQLAKQAGTSQSEYLRQLIDVAFVEKMQGVPPLPDRSKFYGQTG
jgi:hypothetical protein